MVFTDNSNYHGYLPECPVFVSIQESAETATDLSLCEQISRQGTLYTSTTSKITLSFTLTTDFVDSTFLLKYSRKLVSFQG